MAACWQEQLHYHATKSQLSAKNSTLYGLNTRLSWEKGTLRQFLKSSWPATQVIMTLVWYNPNHTCLAPQKMWCPFGWQTKFTTHWVIHGDDHPTHILHPTQGHASVLCRKHRYQSLFSCYYYHSIVPIPARLFLPLSILLLNNHTLIKPAVTPWHQSLDAKPQHAMTTHSPYSNSTSWDQHKHKWLITPEHSSSS